MAEFAREYGRRLKQFDPDARSLLQQYPWPGNVRELRNVIERLMIMVPGDAILPADLGFLDPDAASHAEAVCPARARVLRSVWPQDARQLEPRPRPLPLPVRGRIRRGPR